MIIKNENKMKKKMKIRKMKIKWKEENKIKKKTDPRDLKSPDRKIEISRTTKISIFEKVSRNFKNFKLPVTGLRNLKFLISFRSWSGSEI